jgi:hypothetical protein
MLKKPRHWRLRSYKLLMMPMRQRLRKRLLRVTVARLRLVDAQKRFNDRFKRQGLLRLPK